MVVGAFCSEEEERRGMRVLLRKLGEITATVAILRVESISEQIAPSFLFATFFFCGKRKSRSYEW